MGNNWGMDGVGNNSLGSMKSVGGISNNSGVRSESLALGGGSVFSLEWLADRLVAHLTVSISIDWLVSSVVDWRNSGRDWGVGNGGNNTVGSVSKRGSMDSVGHWSMDSMGNNWSSVDSVGNNWSSMDSVSNWVSHNWSVDSVVGNHRGSVDGVGNWVSNHWGVDSMSSVDHWGVDSVGSNNWSVDSMGKWGVDSVGSYHRGSVGDHSGSNMWSKVSRVRDNSSNTDGSMVSNIRSGGSSSQTKESRDDESLKIFHC